MASYKRHLFFYCGLIAGYFVLVHEFSGIKNLTMLEVTAILVGGFYSLLPDIDTVKSKIHRILSGTLVTSSIMLLLIHLMVKDPIYVYCCVTLLSTRMLLVLATHRGFFHRPVAGIFLSAPFLAINWVVGVFAFLGYSSHLLLDGTIRR